jgi:RimJ/RimL family protein N-acetyltransferase
VDAALRFVASDWRKKVVVAGFFADNPASARVLEKAGFLHTGVVERKFSLARGEEAPLRRMVRLL